MTASSVAHDPTADTTRDVTQDVTPGAGRYRISADIGGTFTDIACLSPEGVLSTHKVPSTPDDYARAIVDGLLRLSADLGIEPARFAEVLHASTVATNAILEGRGANTALITTAGFRDVLELRRVRVPRLYDPLYVKPAPLVPRRRRYELTERMGPRGEVIRALDMAQTDALIAQLAASPVEAIAICFLHAYANPAHEQQVAAKVRAALPHCFVSVSSEVLPEIREYERTSTTVANAYIGPPVARYLRSLQARLKEAGVTGRLLMMQSSGGTLDVTRVIAKPAQVVESGPAAGVVGAAILGTYAGYPNVITFDMGGTTAKASLIENGEVVRTDEYEVGGGISLSSRLVKGGGYALKLAVIDVSEVGAGGGSIVWIDAAGGLKVGPHSAGATPGPACYGAGGTEPTVTDANVVLGFSNRHALAGGSVPIDADRAHSALESRVANVLQCSVLDAAFGVHRLANSTMMRAVKAVSTYRGRDPRDFTLFAFGGNGGIHAVALARELQMRRVVVPPAAGVFSALGLLLADFEVTESRVWMSPLEAGALPGLLAEFQALETKVLDELDHDPAVRLSWRCDLRYAGQAFELPVVLERDRMRVILGAADAAAVAAVVTDMKRDAGDAAADTASPSASEAAANAATLLSAEIREAFETEHRRSYGHIQDNGAIHFVTLRVIGTIPHGGATRLTGVRRSGAAHPSEAVRDVYFGAESFAGAGMHATPVIARDALSATPRKGPLIIEEYEGTTVVPPDADAMLDSFGNIVIHLRTEDPS
jgi:N-methylhydantoinase A